MNACGYCNCGSDAWHRHREDHIPQHATRSGTCTAAISDPLTRKTLPRIDDIPAVFFELENAVTAEDASTSCSVSYFEGTGDPYGYVGNL